MGWLPDTLDNDVVDSVDNNDLPLLCTWAYDYKTNALIYRDGKPLMVEGNEALKQWIYWSFVNERYLYDVNSDQYGTQIYETVGYPFSNSAKQEEVKRYITETLMICPYIKAIEAIEMELIDDKPKIDVRVSSIYDEGWVETIVYI